MNDNRTIIAPSNAKNDIFRHLLKEGEGLIMGTKVIPLSVFMNDLVAHLGSRDEEFSRLYKEAQKEIPEDDPYHKSLRYPVFFRYFYDFVNDLVRHGIGPDDLPDDDRKRILLWLYEKPLLSKAVRKAFDEIEDASNVWVYECFYNDEQDRRDIETLKSKGARTLHIHEQLCTEKQVRVAKNDTQEIASVAQYLIQETANGSLKLDDAILLVNDLDERYPLIRQVLSLYGIPFNMSVSESSDAVRQYVALLRYMNSQDAESFLEASNTGAFRYSDTAIAEYIEYFRLAHSQIMQPFAYVRNWKDRELVCRDDLYERMLKNEDKVEKMMKDIREMISGLALDGSIEEKTASAFDLIRKNFSKDDEEELDCLNRIRELCYETIPGLDDGPDSYEALYHLLEGIRKQGRIKYTNSLEIADVYRNVTEKKLAIVIGCRQDSFPKTVNKKGFFDELYLKKVKGYPSLEDRTEGFNKELDKIFDHIPRVIFSYSTNDLAGNKLYKSVYLEGLEERNWDYEQVNVTDRNDVVLDEKTAEKIFSPDESYYDSIRERYEKLYGRQLKDIKDRKLIMSSSSAEEYVGCPFKYYLDHGLGIKEDDWFDFNVGILGNIQHNSLEKHFRDNGESVEDLISRCFDSIKSLLINHGPYLDLVKERLFKNLDIKLSFIEEAIKDSRFKPQGYEKKIVHALNYDDHSVILNGSIDRLDIDEETGEFMIVDYKSSEKKVDVNSVYNGSKIQLLTYLLSEGEETDRKKAFGSAYFNMEKKRFDMKASDLGTPEEELEAILKEKRSKEDRYQLYTVEGKSLSDDHYSIQTTAFDYEHYLDVIECIYDVISRNILSGRIDIDPRNNVCEFCRYRDICHSAVKNAPASEPIYVEEELSEEVNDDEEA